MPWTWIVALLVGVVLAVAGRLFYRAFTGVTAARDRALGTLGQIWPHVRIEREPGLVVALTEDDRLELDYTLVLRAGLDALDPEPRRRQLCAVLEGALVEQTDPEQLEEELEEAAEALGERYEVERIAPLETERLDASLTGPAVVAVSAGGLKLRREGVALEESFYAGLLLRVVFGVDDPDERAATFQRVAAERWALREAEPSPDPTGQPEDSPK